MEIGKEGPTEGYGLQDTSWAFYLEGVQFECLQHAITFVMLKRVKMPDQELRALRRQVRNIDFREVAFQRLQHCNLHHAYQSAVAAGKLFQVVDDAIKAKWLKAGTSLNRRALAGTGHAYLIFRDGDIKMGSGPIGEGKTIEQAAGGNYLGKALMNCREKIWEDEGRPLGPPLSPEQHLVVTVKVTEAMQKDVPTPGGTNRWETAADAHKFPNPDHPRRAPPTVPRTAKSTEKPSG
jgi:predicted NAD-dependent protein-ADP-ribosyltransferase YbiA (DUF1768 family)